MNNSNYNIQYIITKTYNAHGKVLATKEIKRLTSLKSIVEQLGITSNYATHPLYKKLVRVAATGIDITQAITKVFGSDK